VILQIKDWGFFYLGILLFGDFAIKVILISLGISQIGNFNLITDWKPLL